MAVDSATNSSVSEGGSAGPDDVAGAGSDAVVSGYTRLVQQLRELHWQQQHEQPPPDAAAAVRADDERTSSNTGSAALTHQQLPAWLYAGRNGAANGIKSSKSSSRPGVSANVCAANGAAASAPPVVCWHPWGPAVTVPGPQRFLGLSALLKPGQAAAASQSGADADSARLQQQHQEDSPSRCLEPWLQQALNNGVLPGLLAQRSSSSSDLSNAPEQLPANSTSNGSADISLDPAAPDTAEAAAGPTVASRRAALCVQVRKQWVASRLLQAQGRLEEADAAGKACLGLLQQLSAVPGDDLPPPPAAAIGDAAGGDAAQSAQPVQHVSLPHCQLDGTISTATVAEKLDQMWLSKQLLAAQQKLQELDGVLKQVQQLAAIAAAAAADSNSQQQQQAVQEQQQECCELMLQLVREVHAAAHGMLGVLGPRCLVQHHSTTSSNNSNNNTGVCVCVCS